MKKGDRVLYLVLAVFFLLACGGAAFYMHAAQGEDGYLLQVSSDGELLAEMPLDAAEELLEVGTKFGINVLGIAGDEVRMVSADCPGGDCLRMAPLTSARGAIICLPHRLTVRLRAAARQGGEGLDAVSF